MMPETVAAMAGGASVAVGILYEFRFLSKTMRFWDGVRDLITNDNKRWQASGKLISPSGLEHRPNMGASPATFVLSGVDDELISFAVGAQEEVVGRPCAVFVQFMTDQGENLDNPVNIWSGNMDTMAFRAGAGEQSITLTAETLFVSRRRATYGMQTDRDQQYRYPGDTGFMFMPSLINKKNKWLQG